MHHRVTADPFEVPDFYNNMHSAHLH